MNVKYEVRERCTRINSDEYYRLGAYISKLERLQKQEEQA